MHDIFEKIITREIPADIVYEDEDVIAFLDIKPINYGHTLIVPKKKFVNIFDADTRVLCHMIVVAQKIAQSLKALKRCDGVNIGMNNESSAGQIVFHAHMHVIPRNERDEAYLPAKHVEYDSATASEIAEQLREALQQPG